MEKPLRVLVRIDTRNAAASIEVRGALTSLSCESLLNILRHTATLGANIWINLTRTARIEAAALEVLTGAAGDVERSAPGDGTLQVHIQLPPPDGQAVPRGRRAGVLADSGTALDNDAALDMILRRDTSVLTGVPGTGPAAPNASLARESASKRLPGHTS